MKTILRNGLIVDGTGAVPFSADIEITGSKITSIGPAGALDGESSLDLAGHVISPGFVDIHSHADYTILHDGRAHSAIMQGITSIAVGNCGHGIAPLSDSSVELAAMNIFGWTREGEVKPSWRSFAGYMDALRDRGVATNVFPLVAHGALRLSVAGFSDRKLEQSETIELRRVLEAAMAAGAAGMSTGLEYAPGISSTTEELMTIAEGMKSFSGLYATHCRNRSDAMDKAAAEAVAIARSGSSRLQMSHFVKRPHGTQELFERSWSILEEAKASGMPVFADVFPFDYGPTPLAVLIPAHLREGSRSEMAHKLKDDLFKKQVLSSMGPMFEAAVKNGLVASMYVSCDGRDGEFVGLSLADVADKLKLTAVDAAYWLLKNAAEDFYAVTIVENWARWADLTAALEDPRYYIMGDGATGSLDGPAGDMAPSDWGYAPRFLSDFVRDNDKISLADAIHRMATGPARQLGLTDRGSLLVGQAADIVAFKLDEVQSTVTPSALRRPPTGIDYVWVNGDLVVRGGQPTNALPGVVGLRR